MNQSKIYQTTEIREIERRAIDEFNIPEQELMQRAGQAAFKLLFKQWPECKKIAVFCGPGNNGGDGFVLAHLATEKKIDCKVYSILELKNLKGPALQAANSFKSAGGKILKIEGVNKVDADVIVDALLGIGISGDVRDEISDAIRIINSAKKPVLALDIPSGIHADTGAVLGSVVNANTTITFIACKPGLITGRGPGFCGKLIVDNLDLNEKIYDKIPEFAKRLTLNKLSNILKPRVRDAHKGDFGHVLIIGGDYGMPGAARMAAEAAARVGAGLVSIASHPEHVSAIMNSRPELMCHGVENKKSLKPLLEKATVIVLGPGLGQTDWSKTLFNSAIKSGKPMVVDADGLNLLAKKPFTNFNWVLTPHLGEAARLLNASLNIIQEDRYQAVQNMQNKYGGVVILKGVGSLVFDGVGLVGVCDAGNPGMASGGMGDVLSGVIGGLIAQGMTIEEAASFGVMLHATAGDRAATKGERGLLASDLLSELRKLVNPND